MAENQKLPSAKEVYQISLKLLREHFFVLIPVYLIGLIPFQIFLLYFFLELSVGFHSGLKIFLLSFVALLLFSFFKVTQSIFSTKLYFLINEKPFSVKYNLNEIFYQICIQASSPFVYFICMIITVPYQASLNFYCFSQIVTEEKQNMNLSNRFYEDFKEFRNLLLNLSVTMHGTFLALIVFINFMILVYVLPKLLNSFFGIETVFIKSGQIPYNMISMLVIFNFTFIICDPIFKTAMVIRFFYRKALPTGEDLMYRVRKLSTSLLVIFFLILPSLLNAGNSKTGENIEKVLSQKKYQWRDSKPIETINYSDKLDFLDAIVERIREFFRNLFETKENKKNNNNSGSFLSGLESAFLMKLLILLMLSIVIALIIRNFIVSKKNLNIVKAAPVHDKKSLKPDESRFDEFSADEWEKTAKDRLAAGDFRGAIRALYFHTLLSLGKQNLIHIQRYKTNAQYRHELKTRSHHYPEVYPLFISLIVEFERAWFSEENIQETHFMNFNEFVLGIKRFLQ